MRNKKTLHLLFIISLTLILISCSSEEDIIEKDKIQGDEEEEEEEDVKIINISEERSDEQEEIGEIDGMDEIEKIEDFEEVLQNNKTGIEDII